ncbi:MULTISPECIES: hypothetical protein [unclassified Sulfitobacter]|uniref:hypothetical protein n=1 Tax=unclassified Sulfitobacter TaxID=196795 RepID=UPI0037450C7B
MNQKKNTDKIMKRERERPLLPSEEAKSMPRPSLKAFTAHKENPFLVSIMDEGFSVSVRNTQQLKDEVAYNYKTGEVGGALTIGVTQMVDREQFVKLFSADITTMLGLSPTAARIFFVLINEVQKVKDSDKVYLSLDIVNDLIEQTAVKMKNSPIKVKPVGKTAFYKAMAELLQHDILAPCKIGRDAYWVNPARLFNGSRIVLGKQYIIEQNEQEGLNPALPRPKQMDLSEVDDKASPYSRIDESGDASPDETSD